MKRVIITYKNLFLFSLLVLFLLVDVSMFTLFNTNISALLLCLYTIVLLYQNRLFPMMLSGLFVSLHFFLFYGSIAPLFTYLLPLSILARWAKIIIRKESIIPFLFLALTIAAEHLFIMPSVFGTKPLKLCTFYKICGNLLMLVIFLKYVPKGRRGNRL